MLQWYQVEGNASNQSNQIRGMMTMAINWVYGNLVISGDVTEDEIQEAFDLALFAHRENKTVEERAEALAKAVLATGGNPIEAIKEVKHYVKNHPRYVYLGKPFGLKEAKEIVDRVREQG